MLINFTKMQGLGRDFMVIDQVTQAAEITSTHIAAWSNRLTGVGFDRLLLIEPPTRPDIDFKCRTFNCTGTELKHCADGAQVAAQFVYKKRLTSKKHMLMEYATGVVELQLLAQHRVQANMGEPLFNPVHIPFSAEQQAQSYPIVINEQTMELMVASVATPHAVLVTQEITCVPISTLGKAISHHTLFPEGINVCFIQIINSQYAKLRVWKKDIGEIYASYAGACTAAVTAIEKGLLSSPVTIELPTGSLSIHWIGKNQPVQMTGSVKSVYEGKIRV